MEKTTLYLSLKAQWYEMIESGIKREEYREIKPYWTKRLVNPDGSFKKFDTITFTYGYTKRKMVVECTQIRRGWGIHGWGAVPFKEYYVISLGRILSKTDVESQMDNQTKVNMTLNHFCRSRCGNFDRTKCGICADYINFHDYLTAKYHLPY